MSRGYLQLLVMFTIVPFRFQALSASPTLQPHLSMFALNGLPWLALLLPLLWVGIIIYFVLRFLLQRLSAEWMRMSGLPSEFARMDKGPEVKGAGRGGTVVG